MNCSKKLPYNTISKIIATTVKSVQIVGIWAENMGHGVLNEL